MKEPSALVVMMDGVEELEAVAPIDLLRRAGAAVTTAAAGKTRRVSGRNGIVLEADTLLADCADRGHDLVVIPGGPGHAALAEDPRVLGLLRRQRARGGLIGAICAGPVVLQRAGVLGGRYTAHPSTAGQLPARDPEAAVVRDGTVITSQGAGTAVAFALALVEALCGGPRRTAVAEAIRA